ncbi:MAG: O-antigen ligase family protein [Clostridia bacterium]|nr:O-antigen ligase family protein [Clostridia bacterium]
MENNRLEPRSVGSGVRIILPTVVGILTGIFMLSVVPLYFHDGFFDINRAKVSLMLTVIPYLMVVMGLTLLIMPRKGEVFAGFPWHLLVPMLLFLAACTVSSALRGFEDAVLTGSEGRYGGLYFILAVTAAFVGIALGRSNGILVTVLFLISSTVIAMLGCVNALGVDPLGFYVNMREDQIPAFLSTIGHFDFYGTVLLLPAAVAYGVSVKGKHFLIRLVSCLLAAVLTIGAYAARTDSVWIGMCLIGYSLFFLSGEDRRYMYRALLMISIMVILFPVATYFMKAYSLHNLSFSGMYTLIDFRKGGEMTAIFAILAFIGLMLERHGVPAPGFKRLAMLGLILFLVAAIVTAGLVVYATGTTDDNALFGLAPQLRMDDNFGSRRGYIWARSIRAFMAASPLEKAFGQGMELTKRITRPFIESTQEEQLSGGTYNDTHCQPLQLLLTCGIFGMAMYLIHFVLLFFAVRCYAAKDAIMTGITVAMAGYFGIMLINVTQPILLTVYFALGAVGVARVALLRTQPSVESKN